MPSLSFASDVRNRTGGAHPVWRMLFRDSARAGLGLASPSTIISPRVICLISNLRGLPEGRR